MATFPNRNPMIAEANTDASVSHFAWFHPGNFYSASRTSLNPLQSTKINPEPGLVVAPIRSVAPETNPEKNVEFVTKPTKPRKQRPSIKNSDPIVPKVVRPKQPKKNPSVSKKTKGPILPAAKREKKNLNIVMDGSQFDLTGVPSPVCSCTGVARVCYKWGAGGWQSSCCTTSISEYPLPMSSSRPGSRMAGRKMSNGAYGKLLLRLAAEGNNLSHPVDLKNHWARHGTNKFVTIK